MKLICSLLFIILLPAISVAQEYSFPLFFEDAAGNKDTLYFGFDDSATFGVDEMFGEVNLIDEPLDSVFDVFFTDAATNQGILPSGNEIIDHCLELPHTPTYILKKQINYYNAYPNDYFEFGIIAQNWPVTITWIQKKMEDYVKHMGFQNANLFLYSWHPPQSLIGDVHCCGNWPNDYTILNKTANVVVDKSNFCHYSSTITKDSVNLFYISFSSFTSILKKSIGKISCRYDFESRAVLFSTPEELKLCTIEIFDLLGRKHLKEQIGKTVSPNFKIDVSSLPKGLYIVAVTKNKRNATIKTQKIEIR